MSAQQQFGTSFSEEVLDRLQFNWYEPGDLIFKQSSPASMVHFVVEGLIKLDMQAVTGKRLLVNVLGPPSVLSYSCLTGYGHHLASAQALLASHIGFLPCADFLAWLKDDPTFLLEQHQQTVRNVYSLYHRLEWVAYGNARQRLFALLAELLRAIPTDADTPLHLPLSEHELGQMVGTTRETVARELRVLKQRQLIRIGKREIVVLDAAKLENYIKENL